MYLLSYLPALVHTLTKTLNDAAPIKKLIALIRTVHHTSGEISLTSCFQPFFSLTSASSKHIDPSPFPHSCLNHNAGLFRTPSPHAHTNKHALSPSFPSLLPLFSLQPPLPRGKPSAV